MGLKGFVFKLLGYAVVEKWLCLITIWKACKCVFQRGGSNSVMSYISETGITNESHDFHSLFSNEENVVVHVIILYSLEKYLIYS